MRVNSIELFQFRNYNHFFIEFSHDINIFIGKNAQGKTNLVEAIYVLSVSKSFRTNQNYQMVMFDCPFGRIKANVTSTKSDKDLEIIISEEHKKAKINGQEIAKTSDYVGHLNVVVFIPDDLQLIKGSPSIRRKFIDLELTKISPIYMFTLQKYMSLLKERNKYLKVLNEKRSKGDEYLDVLDEQMAKLQVVIIEKRMSFIYSLSKEIDLIYQKIANQDEETTMKYHCFCKHQATYEDIMSTYKRNRSRDIRYMQTHSGIHKDDIEIFINQQIAQQFASQGQQRTIVLAIKIALTEIIKQEIGEYPVLLLDDVLSELDDQRRSNLLYLLDKKIQTFITTTSMEGIEHQVLEQARKIHIDKMDREDSNNGRRE